MSKYQPPQPRYIPHPAVRRQTWIHRAVSLEEKAADYDDRHPDYVPISRNLNHGISLGGGSQVEHEAHKCPLDRTIEVSVHMTIDDCIVLHP